MYSERPSIVDGSIVWTSASDGSTTRVLPDGCMDLIWWSDKVLVAGPDTHAFLSQPESGTTISGLRLAPGLAPDVLGVPASEFRNLRVDLTQVWGRSITDPLLDELARATDPGRILESLAGQHRSRQRAIGLMARRLSKGCPVRVIAEELNTSERQLHRRSLAAFGYSPKTLARILRFNHALDLVRSGRPLAQSASQAGYADQSHLARETRSFAGVPITALL